MMAHKLGWMGMLAIALVALTGCGDDEEARSQCDQERAARDDSLCHDESSYQQCLAAYDECGGDYTVDANACPTTYSCPTD